MHRIRDLAAEARHPPRDLEGLSAALADIYYGNLSVFQSLPDAWAIDQLFPIMPIHRLKEEPTRNAVVADITCDCDGKIDRFIDRQGVRRSLLLHELKENEEYVLGAFLIGAYQETLGDLHNLFGDTHVVSVRLDAKGEPHYSREIEGDSVGDVLEIVEYDTKLIIEKFRAKAEKAVKNKSITAPQRKKILAYFQDGLRGYTYHEPETE